MIGDFNGNLLRLVYIGRHKPYAIIIRRLTLQFSIKVVKTVLWQKFVSSLTMHIIEFL